MAPPKEKRKLSHLFFVCYAELCKRHNMPTLSSVKSPSNTNKAVLDVCVDRIKYDEWGPILNALSYDNSLHLVAIRYRHHAKKIAEHIDSEAKLRQANNVRVPILTKFLLNCMVDSVCSLLSGSTFLTCLEIEGLPLSPETITTFSRGIGKNKTLQHLSLQHCLIGDEGSDILSRVLRHVSNIASLNLSHCELTMKGANHLAELIKYQKISRYSESWKQTLRYREPDLDSMRGLRRLTLNNNPRIGDEGLLSILDVLQDDLWMKALDFQNCSITDEAGQKVAELLSFNGVIDIVDLRRNAGVMPQTIQNIMVVLCKNCPMENEGRFQWLATTETTMHSMGSSVAASRVPSACTLSAGSKTQIDGNILKRSNTAFFTNRRPSDGSTTSTTTSKPKEIWTPVKIPAIVDCKPSVAEQLKQARTKIRDLQLQLDEEMSERQKVDQLNVQLHGQLMEVMGRPGSLGDGNANREGYVNVEKCVLQDIYKAFNEFFSVFSGVKLNGVTKIKSDLLCNKLQSIIEESPPNSARNRGVSAESPRKGVRKAHQVNETGDMSDRAYQSETTTFTPRAQHLFNALLSLGDGDSSDDVDADMDDEEVYSTTDTSCRSSTGTVRFVERKK